MLVWKSQTNSKRTAGVWLPLLENGKKDMFRRAAEVGSILFAAKIYDLGSVIGFGMYTAILSVFLAFPVILWLLSIFSSNSTSYNMGTSKLHLALCHDIDAVFMYVICYATVDILACIVHISWGYAFVCT